jgi:hypothetical protein
MLNSEKLQSAISTRLSELRGGSILREDYPHYTMELETGLVPCVSRDDFWTDLMSGGGNELTSKPPKPEKFCAAHSSAKLAVNSFGPFRNNPDRLVMASQTGFTEAQFEKKLKTGLMGMPPNLDFFVSGVSSVIAVESKFTEWIPTKKTKFQKVYHGAVEKLADPSWAKMFESLVADPGLYRHLHAAQLVRHYLGMRYSLPKSDKAQILMYVYWEPSDADDLKECVRHRSEINDFAERVSGSGITFQHTSYTQLWDYWLHECKWDGIQDHVTNLRTQYELPSA